eukprot:scaffold3835_cov136-Amphora_coffeaeformis.AAC.2
MDGPIIRKDVGGVVVCCVGGWTRNEQPSQRNSSIAKMQPEPRDKNKTARLTRQTPPITKPHNRHGEMLFCK